MADLVTANYAGETSNRGIKICDIIGFKYLMASDPVHLEVKQGTFVQNTQDSSQTAETSSGSTSLTARSATDPWSEWKWSTGFGRYYRYRQNALGVPEYEYRDRL